MYIISWNINGLKQRFDELKQLVRDYNPDLVCLQKVRSKDREEYQIEGYRQLCNLNDIGNWSGVITYAKIKAGISPVLSMPERISYDYDLGKNGHMQAFQCDGFILVNAYVPFANKTVEGAEEYRMEWDERFRSFISEVNKELPVVICGDLNIVHTHFDSCEKNIELNRPCFNRWEREHFNLLLTECNLIDAYRQIYPEDVIPTFYGNFRHLRIGNRIDYFLISSSLKDKLITSDILTDFGTGQSVPIVLELDLSHRMNRPYIICHMMQSVDGRVNCDMVEHISGDEYYNALNKLNCPSTVEGKHSFQIYQCGFDEFKASDNKPVRKECFHKANDCGGYEISVDTRGTLLWDKCDNTNRLCVMNENASEEYLTYLRKLGISYIATGKERIDLKRAVEILHDEFGVKRLAVVGSGIINGGFLAAGLIDEVSIMTAPGIDGRIGQPSTFDGIADREDYVPFKLKFKEVSTFPNGVVWTPGQPHQNLRAYQLTPQLSSRS